MRKMVEAKIKVMLIIMIGLLGSILLILQGYPKSVSTFTGSQQEYEEYLQKKDELFQLAKEDTQDMFSFLEEIFSSSSITSLNVRIAIARELPLLGEGLSRQDISFLSQKTYEWLRSYKEIIAEKETQVRLDEQLPSLYLLKDALISSYHILCYYGGENRIARIDNLLTTLRERENINPTVLGWALDKLEDEVNYATMSKIDEIIAALYTLQREFDQKNNNYLSNYISVIKEGLSFRKMRYYSGISDEDTDREILFSSLPSLIKYHAYKRLFFLKEVISYDESWQELKLKFLKEGVNKDRELFEEEVKRNKLELPKVRITEISPPGPYYGNTVITLRAEAETITENASINFHWKVWDNRAIFTEFRTNEASLTIALFGFSSPTYTIGVEVIEHTGEEVLTSLMDKRKISILPLWYRPASMPWGLQARIHPSYYDIDDVKLTWKDNPDNNIIGYQIWRKREDAPDVGYIPISGNSDRGYLIPPNSESFVDTQAKLGNVYLYKVAGIAPDKSQVFSQPLRVVMPPTAPSDLCAKITPQGNILLRWRSSKGHQGYKLYRKAQGESRFRIIATFNNSKKKRYVDRNIRFNKTYYYKLLAFNDSGNSPFSNLIIIKSPPEVFISLLTPSRGEKGKRSIHIIRGRRFGSYHKKRSKVILKKGNKRWFLPIKRWTPTRITFIKPAWLNPGSYKIMIKRRDGKISNPKIFPIYFQVIK